MSLQGVFITFEGIEASGKSTQARKLYEWLKERNIDAVLTRDPGGTALGESVRNILLDSRLNICPLSEMFLYASCRAQLVKEVIKPALQKGMVVISDRFSDSFVAYQGFGRGIDLDQVKRIDGLASEGIKPDLTILLDLPVERAMGRLRVKDRMELEDLQFHERVRQGFLSIAREEGRRIVIIDATLSKQEIFETVKKSVEPFLAFPV
jgi:dTMP kinase